MTKPQVPEEIVEAAAKTLIDEGGSPGSDIHSWRCEYPDRYGECDCVTETARVILEAVTPALMAQGAAEVSAAVEATLGRCENFTRGSCADAGRDIDSPYGADGYCITCKVRAAFTPEGIAAHNTKIAEAVREGIAEAIEETPIADISNHLYDCMRGVRTSAARTARTHRDTP